MRSTRTYLELPFAFAMILVGCTSSTTVSDYTSLKDKPRGKTVTVHLVSGEHYQASGFRIDGNTASFLVASETNDYDTTVVEVNAKDISEVVHVRRGKGALQGLGIGAASGALFGAGLGATTTTEDCSGDAFCGIDRVGWAIIGAIVFTIPGALLGTAIGASRGAKERYEVSQ